MGGRSSPTRWGSPRAARRELVVGCVHGNEPAGIAVARVLERSTPRGLDLWILPVLNPDGRAADTRGNAHGVDLNRNFPWHWRHLQGLYSSGPRPLSEPESRIVDRLIRRLRPQVTISGSTSTSTWSTDPEATLRSSGASRTSSV